MQPSSIRGAVRAHSLDGRQDVSKEELSPNESLALKGLRDLLPDHPEHRLLDVLRRTQFDLATAADLCFADDGIQACSPNRHVPSGRSRKPDAQQVPTPEKHPDLFPKENAFVADDYDCVEHQDTLDSQLFQQQVDMHLQSCPEILGQNQGKCRQWWGKQDAHKLRTSPTNGVYAKQADIYCHLTKSPTSPAHSANLGVPSKACLGTEYWPQQGSLNEVAHDLSQELDFEQKISKLCHEFPAVHITEVTQLLSASDGSYDGAFAFLLMQMEERDAEAAARKEREDKDLALAQGLQEVESTPAPAPTTMNPTSWPSSKRANPAAQDNDLDWLTSKDPSMQPKLSSLKRMFPQISHAALQNMLVANEGCLNRTVRAVHSQMPETRLPQNRVPEYRPPIIPGRLAHLKTMSSPSLAPPQGVPSPSVPQGVHTSRPATPGFALQPAVGPQPARLQRSTGRPRGDNDLYNEARSKFRNAQAQIALCKQEFFSAQRAGDYEKQAFCTSQIEYWQQKAVEEKQRAHKKIFSSKNAEVSNTFKVDLHALHVDEAVAEMEKTIQDLSRFKCTWNVEVVTGKGLHSSVDGPKILPAVRHFLKERSYEFWEVPGMVVFKIHPTVSE
ncbi:MAG: hypothetical protein FRX49_05124 [Trebouxia sp. A1-2]|nr:MAG: hypothetical protein FRX49_05124 [Trebouxia sp. A1-2]